MIISSTKYNAFTAFCVLSLGTTLAGSLPTPNIYAAMSQVPSHVVTPLDKPLNTFVMSQSGSISSQTYNKKSNFTQEHPTTTNALIGVGGLAAASGFAAEESYQKATVQLAQNLATRGRSKPAPE